MPLPWQSGAWKQLHEQLASDRLPHALLLAGGEHTGKNRLAMALARLLLCPAPVDGQNCGTCHACEMSRVGNHGDFRWLAPEGKSRAIRVDQVRELVNFASLTASFGQRKVVVFSPAEAMNANAANALLKALEEPARETYLLLVSHRPHRLPATIRSRCQLLGLVSPSQTKSLQWLDQITGKHEDSKNLLKLADGRPLLAEDIYYSADTDTVAAIPLGLDTLRDGRGTVPQVSSLLAHAGIETALGQLATYLRNVIRGEGESRALGAKAQLLFTLLDEVNRLEGAVAAGANPNPQLALESLLAKLQKVLGGA